MTDRPITFSAPMIRALLDGRKSMTRRLATSPLHKCQPGDRLYVREAGVWQEMKVVFSSTLPPGSTYGMTAYRATYEGETAPSIGGGKWKPSIHMPRWASRLTLTITRVKIEPIQQISRDDAMAEGAIRYRPTQSALAGQSLPPTEMWCFDQDPIEGTRLADDRHPEGAFELLWRHLHGHEAWDSNPMVVALSFTVALHNIDSPPPIPRGI